MIFRPMSDSPIDLSALLDAIGCGEATPKKSGKAREPVNEVSFFFGGRHLGFCSLWLHYFLLGEEE